MKKRDTLLFISWALFIILILSTLINVYLILTRGDETPIQQRSELNLDDVKKHIDKSFESMYIDEDKIREIIKEYTNDNKIDNSQPEVIHGKDGVDGKNVKDGIGVRGEPGRDGRDGKDGKDGKDGYTPVKGIDYFDGEAIFVQCNVEMNAWQTRHEFSTDWELLNDTVIPCMLE
jgi:hypothetical protein